MTIDTPPVPARRVLRVATVIPALAALALASPASAAPPETWTEPDNESVLWNILVFGGVPLAVTALIVLWIYLPSMMRKESSGELAFQDKAEWFGGPRKGVDAAPEQAAPAGATEAGQAQEGKGGASAQW